jgi:hypothetical protein
MSTRGIRGCGRCEGCAVEAQRRDLQRGMRDEKKPWEIGKSFDHAIKIV